MQFGDARVTTGITNIINSTGVLSTYTNAEIGTTSRLRVAGALRHRRHPGRQPRVHLADVRHDVVHRLARPHVAALQGNARVWNRRTEANAEVAGGPPAGARRAPSRSWRWRRPASAAVSRRAERRSAASSTASAAPARPRGLLAVRGRRRLDHGRRLRQYAARERHRGRGVRGLRRPGGVRAARSSNAGRLTFHPPGTPITGEAQFQFILNMPTAPANGTILARFHTTSTLGWLDLIYGTGDSLTP